MTDLLIPFFLFTLVAVVIIQALERYFYAQQAAQREDRLLEEISRATKAVIAKNANEYVMTTSIDKVPAERPVPQNSDLIAEESLGDEEFFAAIGKELKEDKKK